MTHEKLSTGVLKVDATPYRAFGEALQDWLGRAGKNQEGLAQAVRVSPSTVTSWVRGRKRPDGKSLVRLLAVLRQGTWLGEDWDAKEALDGILALGIDWYDVACTAEKYLQKGGRASLCSVGGKRPSRDRINVCCLPCPSRTLHAISSGIFGVPS